MTEDQYWKNTNGQESMVPRLAVAAAKRFEKLTQFKKCHLLNMPNLISSTELKSDVVCNPKNGERK